VDGPAGIAATAEVEGDAIDEEGSDESMDDLGGTLHFLCKKISSHR
jgi:hypothetical protein